MGSYFMPWRRKIGVLTLVMASFVLSVMAAGCPSNSNGPNKAQQSSPQPVNAVPVFPATAQSSGAFTVWTIPEKIVEHENFKIVIVIRLPKDAERYTANDLTGEIRGSDDYRQRVAFKSVDDIQLKNGYAEVQVLVPGTVRGTRTEITIQSELIGETASFKFDPPS